MSAKMFVFFLLIICFPVPNSTKMNFDYYKLVLQWPISVCIVNECSRQPLLEFTVHGLWPFLYRNSIVTNCARDELKRGQVKPTKKDLESYWPSFLRRDHFSFWSHQWKKHGTCSDLDPQSYFELAIRTTKHTRNLLASLKGKGYTPKGSTYRMNVLYDKFKAAANNKTIQFKCNEKGGKFLLLEIYICVNKKGVALDCPTPKFIECGDSIDEMAEIQYPSWELLPLPPNVEL